MSCGCVLCGRELEYFGQAEIMRCQICGEEFETNGACTEGHYVCDSCHSKKGILHITATALSSCSGNPAELAFTMMKSADINMHGPEHHYLVCAALLAAYKNAGGKVDLDEALFLARQRSKKVPGGICGLWGSCGAGISTGIFISIITGATPLSKGEWSFANLMTSKSLKVISENGGPRCCKRNSALAVIEAARFTSDNFNIHMEMPDSIRCGFSGMNNECTRQNCLFFSGLL